MANIYELTATLESFLEAVDAGDIPEEAIADTLEAINGEIDAKLDDIACAIKNIEFLIANMKVEEGKIAERRERKERQLQRLSEYLVSAMTVAGKDRLETARNKIGFRTSRSIKVSDVKEFIKWARENAPQLINRTVSEKPSLTEIKANWGRFEMPGVSIEEKKNLQIK